MAKTAKITDLTKIEGDPNPSRADIPDARMYLEMQARGPLHFGFLKFVARCSEHAPVALAIVVTLLLATGAGLVALVHALGLGADVSLPFLALPAVMYAAMTPRRRRGQR
jgi:hypothetical protein